VLILVSKKIAVSFQSCSFVPLFLVCVCSSLFPCPLVTKVTSVENTEKCFKTLTNLAYLLSRRGLVKVENHRFKGKMRVCCLLILVGRRLRLVCGPQVSVQMEHTSLAAHRPMAFTSVICNLVSYWNALFDRLGPHHINNRHAYWWGVIRAPISGTNFFRTNPLFTPIAFCHVVRLVRTAQCGFHLLIFSHPSLI
jgi:hypothetical protein